MAPPHLLRALLLASLLPGLAAGAAAAQEEETTVVVISVTSRATGKPLENAQVIMGGTGIAARTNAAGVLRLAGVPVGVRAVEVQLLGHGTRFQMVSLEAGRAAALTFRLDVEAVPVAAIVVRGAQKPEWDYLEHTGFMRRRKTGSGLFITRAEIAAQHAMHLSDVLRRYPGVAILPHAGGRSGGHATMARNGPRNCPIQYFVDGTLIGPGFNVDDVRADDVEGVEVYRGASGLPPEFNRNTSGCGVIVIWTRIR
jgi:hypothetical protein